MLGDYRLRLVHYGRLDERILNAVDLNGGQYDGTFELAQICNAPDSRVRRELRRLERLRIIHIHRGGGRGNKTRIKRL